MAARVVWLVLGFLVATGVWGDGETSDGPEAPVASVEGTPPVDGAGEEAALHLVERVVVTANRVEQDPRDVPAHLTLLDGADLAATPAQRVDEILRQTPGFSLFRRTSSAVAHPTTQGASLRGLAPSGAGRVLVLHDGFPLNDPFGGWVSWGEVAPAGLERIEVVPGGGSSLWGNYALGGVIHLVTSDPTDGGRRLALSLGERSETLADVGGSERWKSRGEVALALAGRWLDSGGHPVVRADQRGAIDRPAESRHGLLEGRLDWLREGGFSSRLRLRSYRERREQGTALTDNATGGRSADLVLAWLQRGDLLWELSLAMTERDFESRFSAQATDRSSERPALDQFDVDARSGSLGIEGSRQVGGPHRLSFGTDLRWVEGSTHEDFRNLGAGFTRRRRAGGEQSLAGIFLQDVWSPSADWSWTLGARVDRWSQDAGLRREIDLGSAAVLRDDRFEDRETTAWNPRLAFVRRLGSRRSLRAAFYGAFRAPTLNELYRPFRVRNDITEANPELVEERLWGAEVGLDHRSAWGSVRLTVFWSQVDDAVANVTLAAGPGVLAPCGFVPSGGSCRQRRNLGRIRVRGVESDLRLRVTNAWSFETALLWSDGEVVEAPQAPALLGRPLAQVPELQVSSRAIYRRAEGGRLGGLGFWIQGRYLDRQNEDDLGSRRLDSAMVFDLGCEVPLNRRWRLELGGENLFDDEIETGRSATGLVSIGAPRRWHVGIRWAG